jgi:ribosomal protein S12 methylthiotransferase accessory factor
MPGPLCFWRIEFPEKYRNAIVKAAELCTVKKVIEHPPEFLITATMP